MPRFSVGFGRRKSTAAADELENAQLVADQPSFRVLERSQVSNGKSFDGGARLSKATTTAVFPSRPELHHLTVEDNMFADLKNNNRGSGSSNTTKTASTDTSSRHSNVSTAPSSADLQHHGAQEEWKGPAKHHQVDMVSSPATSKPPRGSFLDRAGRTFSFGGNKKQLPVVPTADEHPLPALPTPSREDNDDAVGRPRGMTSSTTSTATPPKLDGTQDFSLDMGSDFGQMFDNRFKRNSAMTLKALSMQHDSAQQATNAPRTLTGNRTSQPPPPPLELDRSAKVEASPYSWSSHHSNDNLLNSRSNNSTPGPADQAPPVPRHGSTLAPRPSHRHPDIIEDENADLMKDSLAASRLLGESYSSTERASGQQSAAGRFRRNDEPGRWQHTITEDIKRGGEDNMFEGSLAHASRVASRYVSRAPSPPRNKVMTPAQFERYRKDKERQSTVMDSAKTPDEQDDDDEDNYDDDEDEVEKQRQAAKQRRKQEAHMTVYRQQMMKVTGESNDAPPRPSLPMSASSPNLNNMAGMPPPGRSDGDEDEDEEIPLAILAAHGFPNKNKPPARLSMMASNPDMRASSYMGRPGSSMGEPSAPAQQNRGSHLPAFARRLPQDPFLGAGLVNGPARESLNLAGGAPAVAPPGAVQPGGLVGVIASEERSRAMRRGSPHVDAHGLGQPGSGYPMGGFDPVQGIPSNMMYNMPQMPPQSLTPGDQAQIQMNQQMQQFMQMQLQFMQMMSAQGQNGMGGRPMSFVPTPSIADMSSRQSFMGDPNMYPMINDPRPGLDPSMRTMSMVQPNSESWIQPGAGGYAPSIHAQGTGYTPSIHAQGAGAVTQAPSNQDFHARRTSTMSGALNGWDQPTVKSVNKSPSPPVSRLATANKADDEDDEEGWEAMKAKREKKRSLWRSKKTVDSGIGALIT